MDILASLHQPVVKQWLSNGDISVSPPPKPRPPLRLDAPRGLLYLRRDASPLRTLRRRWGVKPSRPQALRAEPRRADMPSLLLPQVIEPMLAAAAAEPFDSPAHIFEVLWNGVRALAYVKRRSLRIQDRYGRDITHRYPELHAIARLAREDGLVLDGEITALTEKGRPDFGRLYPRLAVDDQAEAARLAAELPVSFQAFDVLYRSHRPVMDYALRQRKELLRQVVREGPALAVPDFVSREGIAFYEAARQHDLEGIVAKEWSSRYLPGQRSRAWLKIRAVLRDEFVIGGFTYAGRRRSRDPFASLLLGLYDDQGALRYVGEVTGGFQELACSDTARLLDELTVRSCPFAVDPAPQRLVFWCRPYLAATVRFAGWSPRGILRFPVFERLRPDVPPDSCTIAGVTGGIA